MKRVLLLMVLLLSLMWGLSNLSWAGETGLLTETAKEQYRNMHVNIEQYYIVCDQKEKLKAFDACARPAKTKEEQLACRQKIPHCYLDSYIGRGVFLANNIILTAYHVIDLAVVKTGMEDGKYYKYFHTGFENYSGDKSSLKEIKWYDEKNDLAVVELHRTFSAVIPVYATSEYDINDGDRVFAVDQDHQIKEGMVWMGEHFGTNYNDTSFGSNIRLSPGDSGGAVFNVDGTLIGIVTKGVHESEKQVVTWTARVLDFFGVWDAPFSVDEAHHLIVARKIHDIDLQRFLSEDI